MIRINDVDLATLWWEEYKTIDQMFANRWERFERLYITCLHSHDKHCEAVFAQNSMHKIESTLPPLLLVAVKILSKAELIINEILLEAYIKRDPNLALRTLMALPRDFRITLLDELNESYKTWLRQLLGNEVLELLKKTRVELKLVLNVDEVLPLVQRYGDKWREEAKQLLRKALERVPY
jgi:hypothetical protein